MGFFSHPKLNLTGCVRKIDKSSTTEERKKKEATKPFQFCWQSQFS